MLIRARNLLDIKADKTYLATDVTAGGTSLYVRNVNQFNASWGIQLGNTGEELAEILLLYSSTPSGTTLNTTGTTKYAHPTDTIIYAVKYDKVIFKRSTSGTAGTATAIANGTVNITPDSFYTSFDDTTAVSTYAWRAAYYNSVTGDLSADSDWITTSGFSFYSLAKIRDRVKRKLFSSGYIKEDETIDDWINEWLEEMTNTIIDVNKDYTVGTADIAFSGTAELGTITSTDFKEVRKVWFTAEGTNWYQMTKMDLNDFLPDSSFSNTHPYFFYQGDNIIGRRPNDTSGTARVYYYKTSTVLTNDTDELPVAMRNYTKSFVDYALGQAYYLDLKDSLGDKHDAKAQLALNKFRIEITPRHKTGPQYIDLVVPTEGEDDFELL